MRGDLQEGNVYDKRLRGYAFRYQFPPFPVPIPILPSTKIGLLCAFGLWEPSFQAVRAQKVGFCAFFAFGTPDFWLFEHKIEVFVRFCPPKPPFSGISRTKSGFLCAFSLRDPRFQAFQAQNRHFCAREVCVGGCPGRAARVVLLLPGGCCSGCGAVYLFAPMSAKSSFLKVAASVKSNACMPAAMAPSTLAGLSSVKRHSEALSPNFWQSRS